MPSWLVCNTELTRLLSIHLLQIRRLLILSTRFPYRQHNYSLNISSNHCQVVYSKGRQYRPDNMYIGYLAYFSHGSHIPAFADIWLFLECPVVYISWNELECSAAELFCNVKLRPWKIYIAIYYWNCILWIRSHHYSHDNYSYCWNHTTSFSNFDLLSHWLCCSDCRSLSQ